MDSNNDDSDDSNSKNPARRLPMTYLRRPYDPSNSTDMLTIRTSWIRTVHRAAQAYLHQMTSSSTDEGVPTVVSASSITEQDILYAYIWHLLTRARVRGADPTDPMEVVKLFTTVDVRDVLFPRQHQDPPTSDSGSDSPAYFTNLPLQIPAIATVPLHQFLRPLITDETGISHLRRYALLACAIRSAIEEAPRQLQHEGQGQAQEVAPRRVKMAARRDWLETCKGGVCIVSLEEARGRVLGLEGMGLRMGNGRSYGRRREEIGSDLVSLYSSGEETEMGVGIHTVYKPSTPARGDYHAVVLPVREGDRKWRVQLHLHTLDRQWLRRWMEENPGEAAEIVPRVR